MTTSRSATDESVQIVDRACVAIESNLERNLSLDQLGEEVGVNPVLLKRAFRERLGVTPRQFREAIRIGDSRTPTMVDAKWGAGGNGAGIRYALSDTSVGRMLIACTEVGLVALNLGDTDSALVKGLKAEFPRAGIEADQKGLAKTSARLAAFVDGLESQVGLPLEVRASDFQKKVWLGLLRIPKGETRTFAELAAMVGQPEARRAVGAACGANRFAVVIPCHRVVRSDGSSGNYPWGLERKFALMEREAVGHAVANRVAA